MALNAIRRSRNRSSLGFVRARLARWARTSGSSAFGLGFVLLASLLVVGSVHVRVALAMAGAANALGLFAIWQAAHREDLKIPAAAWILYAVALYSGLQALPLPLSVLEWIAPTNAEVWRHSRIDPGSSPLTWAPLSLDPGASLVEAIKWAAYASLFVTSAWVAHRRSLAVLSWLLFVAASVGALSALVHRLLGAEQWLGIYTPKYAVSPWRSAPLLNPNNFAGYLSLGVFAGIAVLRRPGKVPRPFIVLALSVVVAVLVLSASRGAVIALALGLVGFGLACLRYRATLRLGRRALYAVGVAVGSALVGGGGLIGLGGRYGWAFEALTDTNLDKLRVMQGSWQMFLDSPWWGVGRGAFGTAFSPYRQDSSLGHVLQQYPENFILQWLTEWGLVGGMLLIGLALLLVSLRPTLQLSFSALCLVCGFCTLLIHNLVDLSLELFSVAAAAAAILGGAWGASKRWGAEQRSSPVRDAGHPSAVRRATIVGCGVIFTGLHLLAFVLGTPTALEDREVLHAAYTRVVPEDAESVAAFMRRLTSAIERHPGDGYLPSLGALVQYRSGANALPWVSRALERDPRRGHNHLLLACLLHRHGALEQALFELKLAVEREASLARSAARLAASWVERPEQVFRTVPDGLAGAPMLETLARLASKQSSSKQSTSKTGASAQAASAHSQHSKRLPRPEVLLRAALDRDPGLQSARVALIRRMLAALDPPPAGTCQGAALRACLKPIEKLVSDLDPARPEWAELRATLLMRERRFSEAEQLLARHCSAARSALSCFRLRLLAAIRAERADKRSQAARALLGAACVDRERCAKAALFIGNALGAAGDWVGALEYYGRATQEAASALTWTKLAQAAERAGQPDRARMARRRAARLSSQSQGPYTEGAH